MYVLCKDAADLYIPLHLDRELRLLLQQERFGCGHRTPVTP